MMKLFDAHCHLQDPRIFSQAPHIISKSIHSGVLRFSVNGVSENDWNLVKQMSDIYASVIPSFGLHPWYVADRTPAWFSILKDFFRDNPCAAVGEIGLDKGSHGKKINFTDQVEVCQKQLELAKELERPVSIHCVRAFGDLLQIMKCMGPFPAGVIMHSFLGSAEIVPEFAKLGAYFSFSGFLMSMRANKAKEMLKRIPIDRILLESDAPDALPKACFQKNASSVEHQIEKSDSFLGADSSGAIRDTLILEDETLNHPANIREVLNYVAILLEITKEELASISYRNAIRVFSFEGSKIVGEE